MKKHSTIYLPMDELGITDLVVCKENEFNNGYKYVSNVTPLSDVYVFSGEELLELKKKWAEDAFNKGVVFTKNVAMMGLDDKQLSTDKETYINNLSI